MAGLDQLLSAAGAGRPLQDSRSLDTLRKAARDDPRAAIREAAGEFEALFTRELLKSMRASLPKSGLFDGAGRDTMTQMLDDQLAQLTAGASGGLGEMIARHLSRYVAPDAVGGSPAGTVPNAATAPSGGPAPGTAAAPGTAEGAARAVAGFREEAPTAGVGLTPVAWRPSTSTSASTSLGRDGLEAAMERARIVIGNVPDQLRDAIQPTPAVSGLPPRGRPEAFVDLLWPHADEAAQKTGIPAPFIIGQAALESGWGRGEIKRPDGSPAFNLFGIKAGGNWTGDTVAVTTTEYVGNRPIRQVERFRAYGSYGEAFADWARLMRDNPRYAGVLQAADSVRDFAFGLQAAGYATDPRYGAKLEKVIEKAIEIREARDAG